MALTILSQPTDLLIPSQNYCGNLCFELSSDRFISQGGTDAVNIIQINGLAADGEYIQMEGVRLTFRTVGSVLAPGEIEIPATNAATATAIADFFDSALDQITAIATTGPDQVTFTKDAFWLNNTESVFILDWVEQVANISALSVSPGYPINTLQTYAVLYEVRVNNQYPPLFKGEVYPKLKKDIGTLFATAEIKIDISAIPKAAEEELNNDLFAAGGADPNIYAQLNVRFAERVGSFGSSYVNAGTINLLHASCDCTKYDYEEYLPGTSGKKFLYIPGSIDARTLCKGDKLRLTGLVDPGNYQAEVDGAAGGFVVIGISDRRGTNMDFTTAIDGKSGNILVGLGGTNNSNEIGPLEFKRNNSSTGDCCNLSQILFLNCLGGWQYMGITTFKSGGINVRTVDYINCKNCGGKSKQRTAVQAVSVSETYFTRPLKATDENLELLTQFFAATALYDLDNNQVKLSPEEYAIETPEKNIQIPFTISRVGENYGLIDSVYNMK